MKTMITPSGDGEKNPLKEYDRNTTCFICNSGKKLKKCCGFHEFITREAYNEILKVLKKIDRAALRSIKK